MDQDFAVVKINMCNAFNFVSPTSLNCSAGPRGVMDSTLLCGIPWVIISSEAGVQQGAPLGPMFFYLVLHKLVTAITTDNDCTSLLFHRWYIDDGVVAGPKPAVAKVFYIIQELGPPLGILKT